MLSICIPIYNTDVSALVEGLLQQASSLGVPYQIVLIDDCSTRFINENSRLAGDKVSYTRLNENIGRSRTRNRFLAAAKYDYLLFLDCDSKLVSPGFLNAYAEEAKRGEKLVCGGRVYTKKPPSKDTILHWTYGVERESKPASVRAHNPNRSFMTNNFMVKKDVLQAIKFDERLSGYGHEDTLFGYELRKNNIPIKHIENPVLHGELQTNKEFLQKTEQAISNLKKVLEFVNYDKAFIEDVTLLKQYYKLKRTGMLFVVKAMFAMMGPVLKERFQNGYTSMSAFSFYKLGYLAVI